MLWSLLSVSKIGILMLACQCPCTPLKISYEIKVNLKSASFIIIMLLQEGLIHIQSQIKLWLLFGEGFTLSRVCTTACLKLWGTTPEDRLMLIMARTDSPVLGKT